MLLPSGIVRTMNGFNPHYSDKLAKAVQDMGVINETLDAIEKRIYWELEQLENRVNPKNDPSISQELRLYVSDFIKGVANNINDGIRHD